MKQVRSSAAGKAIISGEYAVLRGAPAICMAVDCRALVTAKPKSGNLSEVTAPGLVAGKFQFAVDGQNLNWQQPEAQPYFGLLEAAWGVVFADRAAPAALQLQLDTTAFHDSASGSKLGLGSSASLSVALVAALETVAGVKADTHNRAHETHARFQQKSGSGVDVAAAFQGGLICYTVNAPLAPVQISWPQGLRYRFVWTGQPVATTDKLQQFASLSANTPSFAELMDQASRTAGAFRSGEAAEVIVAMRAYTRALRAFDDSSGLEIYGSKHAMISAAAENSGLCYKPCGAGGGDVGVVLYTADDEIEVFERELVNDGVQLLPLSMDPAGLTICEE